MVAVYIRDTRVIDVPGLGIRTNTRCSGRDEIAAAMRSCRSATRAANRADVVELSCAGLCCESRTTASIIIHSAVHRGDLLNPLPTLNVFHGHDLCLRPMKVVCDKGYLLVQVIEGVA
jgi:hypothetical protein